MTTQTFALVVQGSIEPVFITATMDFGGKQQVVIYEAPGTNGGVIITTGRISKTITLNGQMLAESLDELANLREKWEMIRDNGQVVTLISPIGDGPDTGNYIIEEFSGTMLQGQERYFNFSMTLREYRQGNLRQSVVNNIHLQARENAATAQATYEQIKALIGVQS